MGIGGEVGCFGTNQKSESAGCQKDLWVRRREVTGSKVAEGGERGTE